MDKLEEKALALIQNGYDLHVHTAPSAFPRSLDSFQLVQEAAQVGMAGVLLKSHYECTATRATLINQHSHLKTIAYGAVALNWPVGGLNIFAVDYALKVGAKIVFMPTRDSANSLNFGTMEGDFFNRNGITILDEGGRLRPCVYDIMDVVKQYGACLATGHLSPAESILLCKEGRQRGVRMILTHPEFPRTIVPCEVQKELADIGVLVEKNWFNIAQKATTIEAMANTIRTIGTAHVYIATDRGQWGTPHPVEELRHFVAGLLKQGFNESEIRDLVSIVPKSIVD